MQLTDRQKDVLDLIRQNNKVSRKELSKLLDIAESAIQKHLEALKEKGAIKREVICQHKIGHVLNT
jgi:predicted ArsR family transcriptional regulator